MSLPPGHSETVTEGIRIRVGAQFVEEHSDPDEGRWVYAYRVVIRNEGEEPARLLHRRWLIRDADNRLRVVEGEGVVGQTPEIAPGQVFSYISGCPLPTSWGSMEGYYRMERPGGGEFRARIGRFFLAPNLRSFAELDGTR